MAKRNATPSARARVDRGRVAGGANRQRRDSHQVIGAKAVEKAQTEGSREKEQRDIDYTGSDL